MAHSRMRAAVYPSVFSRLPTGVSDAVNGDCRSAGLFILKKESIRLLSPHSTISVTRRATNHVKSVNTTFKIIMANKDLDGARVTRLAEAIDKPPSTVHNHLSTLQELGYVKEGETYQVARLPMSPAKWRTSWSRRTAGHLPRFLLPRQLASPLKYVRKREYLHCAGLGRPSSRICPRARAGDNRGTRPSGDDPEHDPR